MPVTMEQLAHIMPQAAAAGRLAVWHPALVEVMLDHEITTPGRMQMFLSTVAEETGELSAQEENLNYSPGRLVQLGLVRDLSTAQKICAGGPQAIANYIYADANRPPGYRMGNIRPGDGWRYRGRGPMQLTGRGNYERFFRAIGLPPDTDPDYLLTPEGGAKAAAHFWQANGCNQLADAGDFNALVRRVNGGNLNMEARLHYYQLAREALPDDPAPELMQPVAGPVPAGLFAPPPEDPDKGAMKSKTIWTTTIAGGSIAAANADSVSDAVSHASSMAAQASTFMGSLRLFTASLGGAISFKTILIGVAIAALVFVVLRYRKKVRAGLIKVL